MGDLPANANFGTPNLTSFSLQAKTEIEFGPGTIRRLGELARGLFAENQSIRALIVSDPGIVAAGHVEKGAKSLRESGIDVAIFDGARENPTTEHVEAGLIVANEYRPNLLIGMGGGSSMDCAKGINFLFTNGGRMQDYWGIGKAKLPMLPMIAIPTTAGTGSELQSFALISDAATHAKMACGDKKAACRIALLDPELTLTQPRVVTALTGIDAISHAIETYVTKKRNLYSLMLSREAWRLLAANLPKVLLNPSDIEARGGVQFGASIAGLAIEHSMLGASHALANPLTANFGTVHGQAVGLMLPHVIRFNANEFGAWYGELADDLLAIVNPTPRPLNLDEKIEFLATWLTGLLKEAGLKSRVNELGVGLDDLGSLAGQANQQWTKNFNPRSVGESELLELYRSAF